LISIKWGSVFFNVEGEEKIRRAFFSKKPFFEYKRCRICEKLERYFRGEKVNFDFEFELSVSDFTRKVLEETMKIPYGEIRTYKEIAEKLETSPRAVGRALAKNPIAVLIPCHRVVGKNSLGGYSWGIELKRALLKLEGIYLP
jgi:methylated-DNA-[protein]-cysteine S-methyltransferase